jgi:uncharacterized protein YwlG (UPF0340 family)
LGVNVTGCKHSSIFFFVEKEKRKLERRQSVAVMETVKTSTKKRSRAANMMKSPKCNM